MLLVDVWKNLSTAVSSNDGEFDTSTTTAAPSKASASPSPVSVFTPESGDAGSTWWHCSPSSRTSFDPMSPVPPITTIFMRPSSLRRHDRRGALVLQQKDQKLGGFGAACVPSHDMDIVGAFIEGLSGIQRHLRSSLHLHHDRTLQHVDECIGIVPVDRIRSAGGILDGDHHDFFAGKVGQRLLHERRDRGLLGGQPAGEGEQAGHRSCQGEVQSAHLVSISCRVTPRAERADQARPASVSDWIPAAVPSAAVAACSITFTTSAGCEMNGT